MISDIGLVNFGLSLSEGLELIKTIRLQDKKTPVIILSRLSGMYEENAYGLGASLVASESKEVLTYLLVFN